MARGPGSVFPDAIGRAQSLTKEADHLVEQDNLGSFGRWLGLEIVEATSDRVVLAWDVRPELWQPYEIVHGGVHCAVHGRAAGLAAALCPRNPGKLLGGNN